MIRKKRSSFNNISSVFLKPADTRDSGSESGEQLSYLQNIQVRWFYREADEKRWKPFNGYDSLNLEAKYNEEGVNLSRKNVTNSWPTGLENVDDKKTSTRSITSEHRKEYWATPIKVPVMSGLYDADLGSNVCHPVYWTSPKRPMHIRRGIWFKDVGSGVYEPLEDEAVAERIEAEYVMCFIGGMFGKTEAKSMTTESAAQKTESDVMPATLSAPSLLEALDGAKENNKSSPPASSTTGDSKRKLVLHTVKFSDCHVDFYGADEAYLYQDTASLYIRQKLGMPKVGIRLRRGYKELARFDDKPPDVTHLCFVVHGIGQKMGLYSIAKSVEDFREACTKLQNKYFIDEKYKNKRVEFLPVEWRSSLQLDGDTVESITPAHVRGLRTTLNSSAMDIMYYTSPLYRTEIITSLLSELNRLYSMFISRNPFFESQGGKVSLLAHSLGCVLSYDLITGWNQPAHSQVYVDHSPTNSEQGNKQQLAEIGAIEDSVDSEGSSSDTPVSSETEGDPVKSKSSDNPQKLQYMARLGLQLEAAKTEVSRLQRELTWLQLKAENTSPRSQPKYEKEPEQPQAASSFSSNFSTSALLFKNNLQNLFCLGSPLPVFLVLRGVRPGGDTTQDSILPRSLCPRIFNIYHPADPVAYRLEPLILRHYSAIHPAVIHRVDTMNKPDYDEMPLITVAGKEIQRQVQKILVDPDLSDERPEDIVNNCVDSPSQESCDVSSQSCDHEGPSITNMVIGLFQSSNSLETVDQPQCEASAGGELSNDEDDETKTLSRRESTASSSQEAIGVGETLDSCESNNSLTHIYPTDESLDDSTGPQNQFTDFSLQLEHRLDYELRASRYENLYLSILSAHTGYWCNVDVCMLVLTQLLNT